MLEAHWAILKAHQTDWRKSPGLPTAAKATRPAKHGRMGDCEGSWPLLLAVNRMQQRYAQDAGNVVLQFFKI